MQVNRIQSYNYSNQPNFKALILTKNGTKVLRRVFSKEQLEQVAKVRKDLGNTKHFDLEIDAIGNELFYEFKHKTNHFLNSEAPLHPRTLNGNKLGAYGISLLDCGEIYTYENLRFPTTKEAEEAYSKLSEHAEKSRHISCAVNSFDNFKWAVDSTKILDRAAEYTGSDAIIYGSSPSSVVKQPKPILPTETAKASKPSITQRIKNAWQALKGN